MEKKGVTRPLSIVLLVLGVLAVVGALTFAKPCVHADGSLATCHSAGQAIWILGAVVALCALVQLFSGKLAVKSALADVMAVLGVVMVLAPGTLFPLCMMQTMRCWTTARPFAMLVGGVIAVVALVSAILCFRAQGKKS